MAFSVFDAHCDTLSKILDENKSISKNDLHFDIERARKNTKSFVQIFAAFAHGENSFLRVNNLIDVYQKMLRENSFIKPINSINDLKDAGFYSILSIEGGDAIGNNIENLDYFYNRGVRCLTLTWNYSNFIADGILSEEDRGLSDFGKKVVRRMNNLGMMIDVSHLCEKGFWNVAEASEKPFIASHSNTRKYCRNKRNLTDEQIREIIRQKGCIGINFYPVFLTDGQSAEIYDIIKHTEHILSLGGADNVGFGSDFDGIDCLPDGIDGAESFDEIINEFLKLGYSEELLCKICYDNFVNVFKKVWE